MPPLPERILRVYRALPSPTRPTDLADAKRRLVALAYPAPDLRRSETFMIEEMFADRMRRVGRG